MVTLKVSNLPLRLSSFAIFFCFKKVLYWSQGVYGIILSAHPVKLESLNLAKNNNFEPEMNASVTLLCQSCCLHHH